MILRPRQRILVERSLAALAIHGNTLAVSPTGSGKTLMLSAVAGSLLAEPDAKTCIVAHRDELTGQNRAKFARVNPGNTTSVFDAQEKSWVGRATFAMVQTLARDRHLEAMPTLDLLVIDETHHAAAPSYRRIIDQALTKNPQTKIYGVTATAVRADGKGLREVFTNVADQITLAELIASGHLVPPRTFVVDVGPQDALKHVRRLASDFDMTEVESILNKTPINDAVIRHWREKAGDRKTIVFCSTRAPRYRQDRLHRPRLRHRDAHAHGSLEQEADLDGHEPHGPMPTKDCPQCRAIVPLGCRECPLCGFEWSYEAAHDHGPLSDFVMTEIDLLNRSNFRWCDLFGHDDALMATGFDAWGGVFALDGRWHAIGGGKDLAPM